MGNVKKAGNRAKLWTSERRSEPKIRLRRWCEHQPVLVRTASPLSRRPGALVFRRLMPMEGRDGRPRFALNCGSVWPTLASVNYNIAACLIPLGLFAGMLLLLEAGRRIGLKRRAKDLEGARAGLGAVEGAIFGLMGLLIAFTFSGAAARFDARRQIIVQEANAIGTAWLRLDLLPPSAQPALRDLFRRYLDTRIEIFQKIPDLPAAMAAHDRGNALQGEIWNAAIKSCQDTASPATTTLLLSAINEMIDITNTRFVATQTHPPPVIFLMLMVLALMSSLLAGYGMAGSKTRSWMHILGFAIIMGATVYVIVDLEFPRLGFLRINTADQVMIDLRSSMK